MEIRMRSNVTRTAKGYSIEATLDMEEQRDEDGVSGNYALGIASEHDAINNFLDDLSAFQIAKLKQHLTALGTAFPREEA